jgi:hypothetical protein
MVIIDCMSSVTTEHDYLRRMSPENRLSPEGDSPRYTLGGWGFKVSLGKKFARPHPNQ